VKRLTIVLSAILLFTHPLTAQTVDKAKLLAATYLPTITAWMKVSSDDLDQREPCGKRIDNAKKIADLKKRLNGTAGDGEVYLDLAECYAVLKDEVKRAEMGRKAEEILRPHVDKAGPADGRLLAAYCTALWVIEPVNLPKREKWCRLATQLAPGEWRCWAQLGNLGQSRFFYILNSANGKAPEPGSVKTKLPDLVALHPSAASVDEAERCLGETRKCFAEVRRLAPHDPVALTACFRLFDGHDVSLGQTIDVLRGLPMVTTPRRDIAWVDDSFELAELYPDNMTWQMQACLWAMTFAFMDTPVPSPANADKAPWISPQGRQAMQKYLDRLIKGGENKDPQAAAYCQRALAYFYTNVRESKSAEAAARRTLELDPDWPEVWDLLGIFLYEQDRQAESLEVLRSALKRFPTAHSYMMLAKTLGRNDQLPEAEKVLRDAVKAFPDDLTCMGGLAAVLILRSDKADTLPEATRLMQAVNYQIEPEKLPTDLVRDLTALTVIIEALTNHEEQARSLFAAMMTREPETVELRMIRAALGP
jgi:tetratricopeptide (TPR) repeat protein